MNAIEGTPGVTGEVILEAEFDGRIAGHGRFFLSLILLASIVGIPLIPFWLIFSLWYYPEFLRRISARLTSQAVEIKKGVFFRKEVTIPLDRITDLRLHDGPLMRYFGLRGVAIETAGQAGRAMGGPGAADHAGAGQAGAACHAGWAGRIGRAV